MRAALASARSAPPARCRASMKPGSPAIPIRIGPAIRRASGASSRTLRPSRRQSSGEAKIMAGSSWRMPRSRCSSGRDRGKVLPKTFVSVASVSNPSGVGASSRGRSARSSRAISSAGSHWPLSRHSSARSMLGMSALARPCRSATADIPSSQRSSRPRRLTSGSVSSASRRRCALNSTGWSLARGGQRYRLCSSKAMASCRLDGWFSARSAWSRAW